MIVLDVGIFGYWRMGEFKLVIQRIKMNEKYLLLNGLVLIFELLNVEEVNGLGFFRVSSD